MCTIDRCIIVKGIVILDALKFIRFTMSLQIDFGIAIQQLRKQRGLSQERLALEADIDRRYMSDVENGKRNISLDIMERIARKLGIEVSELIRQAEEVSKTPLTIDTLKEWLCDSEHEDTIVLESPDYLSAIIGITEEGRLIYSYDKMVEHLMREDGMDAVMSTALKRDYQKYKREKATLKDVVSIDAIIRDAYGYKKEIFEKRLEYIVGEGTVRIKENADKGSQHVIIFDEAQRAWTQRKMIKPGQAGKKYWQEEQFPFSEPGILLWDMNLRDWGVFVCLVGGGQEIHDGEAGINEWLRALKNNEELKGWHIYMADELKGAEYNREDEENFTIEDYRKYFMDSNRLTVDKTKSNYEIQQFYMKNAYRVLLTRARKGMIIFVPDGDTKDQSRAKEIYDSTYNYLKSLGLQEL